MLIKVVEREAEAGGKLGELDSYEIEGGETKSEVLQNLTEFQFSCVGFSFMTYQSLIFIWRLDWGESNVGPIYTHIFYLI